MAEGHLAVRWAQRLERLVGQPLEAVNVPSRWVDRAKGLVGQTVREVTTHGKHLLVHFSNGQTLHCHAMMYGSWQFGSPAMALRKPAERVRVRLRTREHEAVFFSGPVAELLTEEELAAHPRLSALGPDVMAPDFDRAEAWRRLQREPAREVADAILDQTVVAGIGNIYKSEGLFLARIHPQRPTGDVSSTEISRLWGIAIPLMWRCVPSGRIQTRPKRRHGKDERLWVYQRRGRPCLRCEDKIVRIVHGKPRRSSYFCPTCQPRSGMASGGETLLQRTLPGLG